MAYWYHRNEDDDCDPDPGPTEKVWLIRTECGPEDTEISVEEAEFVEDLFEFVMNEAGIYASWVKTYDPDKKCWLVYRADHAEAEQIMKDVLAGKYGGWSRDHILRMAVDGFRAERDEDGTFYSADFCGVREEQMVRAGIMIEKGGRYIAEAQEYLERCTDKMHPRYGRG